MATSFLEYKGSGFWTTDSGIQLWLAALAKEAEREQGAPEWLQEAGKYWLNQALYCLPTVNANFSALVKDSESVEMLVVVAKRALQKLESMAGAGETRIALSRFGLYVDDWPEANEDMALDYVITVGRTSISLLHGEIPPELSPAPRLRVTGLVHFPQRTRSE